MQNREPQLIGINQRYGTVGQLAIIIIYEYKIGTGKLLETIVLKST